MPPTYTEILDSLYFDQRNDNRLLSVNENVVTYGSIEAFKSIPIPKLSYRGRVIPAGVPPDLLKVFPDT